MDFAASFSDPDDDLLSYSVSGLPLGTGLVLNTATGVLSGSPLAADALADQPMELEVVATDAKGGSTQQVFALTIIVASLNVGDKFLIDMAALAGTAESYTYTMSGLAEGTGFELDPASGRISGHPTAADAALPQPLRLIVGAKGATLEKRMAFRLRVRAPETAAAPVATPAPGRPLSPSQTLPPSGANNDDVTSVPFVPSTISAIAGEEMRFDASRNFVSLDQSQVLSFAVFGLPEGTGLSMNPVSGMLSGMPLLADTLAVQPLQLVVSAESPTGKRHVEQLAVSVSAASLNLGQAFQLDVSSLFAGVAPGSTPTFNLVELPVGSGLKINRQTGVISGAPSLADAEASQPLVVQALATVGGNPVSQLSFQLSITLANAAPISTSLVPTTVVLGQRFNTDISTSFFDSDGDQLTFSMSGLPQGSRIQLDPLTGALFGTPGLSDVFAPQPVSLRVSAADSHGAVAWATLDLFTAAAEAAPGEDLSLDLINLFQFQPSQGAVFDVIGLPQGTGLKVHPFNAILFGKPSQADARASVSRPLALHIIETSPQVFPHFSRCFPFQTKTILTPRVCFLCRVTKCGGSGLP